MPIGTGLPIPKAGDELIQPPGIASGGDFGASSWGKIAQASEQIAKAGLSTAELAYAQRKTEETAGSVAGIDLEARKQNIDLHNTWANTNKGPDPQGYWQASEDAQAKALEGIADPKLREHAQQKWNQERLNVYGSLQGNVRQATSNNAAEAVSAKVKMTSGDMVAAAQAGTLFDPTTGQYTESGKKLAESLDAETQTAVNLQQKPPEWKQAVVEDAVGQAAGVHVGRLALEKVRAGDVQGAYDMIDENLVKNEGLNMSPSMRTKVAGQARQIVNQEVQQRNRDRAEIKQSATFAIDAYKTSGPDSMALADHEALRSGLLRHGDIAAAAMLDRARGAARFGNANNNGALPTLAAPGAAPGISAAPVYPGGKVPGLVEAGNIDLTQRPQVKLPDGRIATVRSMSFNEDGKEVLVPTISPEGKVLSEKEAIDRYKETGQHLGKFDTPDQATEYAKKLSEAQGRYYGAPQPSGAPRRGAGIVPNAPTVGQLQDLRGRFGTEMQTNPALRDRFIAYTLAEANKGYPDTPQGQLAWIESTLNRGNARRQTLDATIPTTGRSTAPGTYFPVETHAGVAARLLRGVTQAERDAIGPLIEQALAGSNTARFATGNASLNVGFGYGRGAMDPFTLRAAGERYGIEKGDEEWARAMQAAVGAGTAGPTSIPTVAMGPTNAPSPSRMLPMPGGYTAAAGAPVRTVPVMPLGAGPSPTTPVPAPTPAATPVAGTAANPLYNAAAQEEHGYYQAAESWAKKELSNVGNQIKNNTLTPDDAAHLLDIADHSQDKVFRDRVEGMMAGWALNREPVNEEEKQGARDLIFANAQNLPGNFRQELIDTVNGAFETSKKLAQSDPTTWHLQRGGNAPELFDFRNLNQSDTAMDNRRTIGQAVSIQTGQPVGDILRDVDKGAFVQAILKGGPEMQNAFMVLSKMSNLELQQSLDGASGARLKSAITSAQRSSDPDKIGASNGTLDIFAERDALGFKKLFDSDTEERLDAWRVNRGIYSPQELADLNKQYNDPAYIKAVEEKGKAYQAEFHKKSMTDVTGEFQSWLHIPFTRPTPINVETGAILPGINNDQQQLLMSEMGREYVKMRALGVPDGEAMGKAKERLARVWDVSDTNNGALMRFPPEKFYSPINGKSDYIREQLDHAIDIAKGTEQLAGTREEFELGSQRHQLHSIQSDRQTEREIANKQLPSYKVIVTNPATQQVEILTDVNGREMRFKADRDAAWREHELRQRYQGGMLRSGREAELAAQPDVPALPGEPTVGLPGLRPRSSAPAEGKPVRAEPGSFREQLMGDLRQQFPDESEKQIAARFEAVDAQLETTGSAQKFSPESHAGIRVNQANWDRFIRESPKSTNIEDRRALAQATGGGGGGTAQRLEPIQGEDVRPPAMGKGPGAFLREAREDYLAKRITSTQLLDRIEYVARFGDPARKK